MIEVNKQKDLDEGKRAVNEVQPIPPSSGPWCYRASISLQGQNFWTTYFVIIR
jgi:hypothetical protein